MKLISAATAALALAACSNPQPAQQQNKTEQRAAAQRPSDAESEAYMRNAEADWAEVAVRPMPGLLERILADDYVGVNSDNAVRDKAQMLAQAAEPRSGNYASSTLEYVRYRHFGDTVLAQGQEAVHRKDGGPDLRLIWTDVWMWRDGKWQIVASQDSVLPPRGRPPAAAQAKAKTQAGDIEVIRGTRQKSSSSISPANEIEVIRGTGRRSEPAKAPPPKPQGS